MSRLAFNHEARKPITTPLRFIFVPKNTHIWYDPVRAGIEEALQEQKRLGVEVHVSWDAPPAADMAVHKQKIEAGIRAKPDGLAVACLAPTTDTRIINEAVKAGLHVITFDTDAPDSLRATYVGHSQDAQDGADLAEYLAKTLNYQGKVGILTGNLTAPNHVGRVNGFKTAIAKHHNMSIVFANADGDDLEQAETLMAMALKNHPDLQGMFCCNATNPIGCARVVKKAGKCGQIHIVGMDALPETIQHIQDGVIDAVKVQRQREIGYWSIMYLVALNQGHTVPKEHQIGTELITKEDV